MNPQKYKLLIIDDDKEILFLLKKFFSHTNCETVTVDNGLDGMRLFEEEKERFDLVITDLVMSDISGVAVISMIKKENPVIPVIAMTGYGEHPEALATEANADVIMEKPLELARLKELVMELLRQREVER